MLKETIYRRTFEKMSRLLVEDTEKGLEHLYKRLKNSKLRKLNPQKIKRIDLFARGLRTHLDTELALNGEPKAKKRLKPLLNELVMVHEITMAFKFAETKDKHSSEARRLETLERVQNSLKELKENATHLDRIGNALHVYWKTLEKQLDRKTHYSALEKEAEQAGAKPKGAVLVAARNPGRLFGSTLRVQEILRENRNYESVLAILPRNHYEDLKSEHMALKTQDTNQYHVFKNKGVDLHSDARCVLEAEEIPFWVLTLENQNLLETALKLFSETPTLNFSKSLELAGKL